jgi:DNA polymerase-3 subunit delta'
VIPEADQEERADAPAEKAEGGKAASRQIVIDQIRALQQALTTGGHRGSQRVVIVDPAEAMNVFTANALLKLLEEPTTKYLVFTGFFFAQSVCCQLSGAAARPGPFPRPPAEQAARWLAERKLPDAPALLAFCGGMPLAAADMAEGGGAAARRRFADEISTLSGKAACVSPGSGRAG